MAGVAGYLTVLKKSGTATVMTSDPMTSTGSTVANRYQISAAAKQVFDRNTVPTFRGGGSSTAAGSTIAASAVASVNYLFGTVTFSSTQPEPVKVTGKYMPMTNVAGAKSYTLSQAADVLDDTDFSSTGYHTRKPGLNDVSLTVSRWHSLDLTFWTLMEARASVVAELQPGGSGSVARGWFVVESETHTGDVSALEESELVFQLDDDGTAAYAWSTE